MGGDMGGERLALVGERRQRDIVLQAVGIAQDAARKQKRNRQEAPGRAMRNKPKVSPARRGFESRTFFCPVADTMAHAICLR
jgi:hypothetical protein